MADSIATAAIDAAWASAWRDFLSNKINLAERRATPIVTAHLQAALDAASSVARDHSDAALDDRLITLADLAHIAGAARNDTAILEQAIRAYDAFLHRQPCSVNAMRMRAETLLRCRKTAEAFAAFDELFREALAEGTSEVAAFQLLHDAECTEDAVRLGANASHLAAAAAWRTLAEQLQKEGQENAKSSADGAGEEHSTTAKTRRHAVASLSLAQRALLGAHGRAPLPLPPAAAAAAALTDDGDCASPTKLRALRSDIDWVRVVHEYNSMRAVVIDDLLAPPALAALQAYTRHGAHFRTLRNGYLGAFPADGTTHPLVLALAEELAAAAPAIFAPHTLALWWIFKYDSDTNPSGIGIHADPAAVNINLWLTDDSACLDGGGLVIYSHVPPLEQPTQSVNREYESAAAEASLRETLQAAGRVLTVPYRCNRASIFVSDQYHESLPFTFASGYDQRRANLTLLFGDRWRALSSAQTAADVALQEGSTLRRAASPSSLAPLSAVSCGASGSTSGEADGFDVFDL